jgi:2-amino-4-hydroxy-6-hydroxymethyldihydropteridine diphosphokinase
MSRAFLGLGSNLGDKAANIREAVRLLEVDPDTQVVARSSFYSTAPVGYLDQDDFINAVVEIQTSRSPLELLGLCHQIEQSLGRIRILRWGPRTMDMDILWYDDVVLESPELTLPHPRMSERAFVLVPLAEIAPEIVLGGQTAEAWLKSTDASNVKVLSGESW